MTTSDAGGPLPFELERGERRARWIVAAVLLIQAVAIPAWWWALERRPEWRTLFFAAGTARWQHDAFRLADVALLTLGSLAGSALAIARSGWAIPAVWSVAGGLAYATLQCVGVSVATDDAWVAVALMAAASLASVLVAGVVTLDQGVLAIRVSRTRGFGGNFAKTLAQIVVVWGVALALLPWAIVFLERRIGIDGFELPGARTLAVALFGAGSALGLWASTRMNRLGEGTPLPFDTARKLVLVRPYDRMRNPMAVGGATQAVAVAIALGSVSVLIYAAAGALAWNYLARPYEESDLFRRFGADYLRYRAETPCWRWRGGSRP